MIYFVQADIGGPIKIGHTTSLSMRNRLADLQCGSPFKLCVLRQERGNTARERELHLRFAHLRLHGEWFRAGRELVAYLNGAVAPARPLDVAPPVTAWSGPLLERDQAVLDALTAAWSSTAAVARRAGVHTAAALGSLQRLRRYARAQRAGVSRGHVDWRARDTSPALLSNYMSNGDAPSDGASALNAASRVASP
jgi:hypothetical protein